MGITSRINIYLFSSLLLLMASLNGCSNFKLHSSLKVEENRNITSCKSIIMPRSYQLDQAFSDALNAFLTTWPNDNGTYYVGIDNSLDTVIITVFIYQKKTNLRGILPTLFSFTFHDREIKVLNNYYNIFTAAKFRDILPNDEQIQKDTMQNRTGCNKNYCTTSEISHLSTAALLSDSSNIIIGHSVVVYSKNHILMGWVSLSDRGLREFNVAHKCVYDTLSITHLIRDKEMEFINEKKSEAYKMMKLLYGDTE